MVAVIGIVLALGCARSGPRVSAEVADLGQKTRLLVETDAFFVVVPGEHETFASLALYFLGDAELAWWLDEANPAGGPDGHAIVIPRKAPNPSGVSAEGFQTVPILAYHRLGENSSAMTISPAKFREQMAYLADRGYRVVGLNDLLAFLHGQRALPPRSVVISFDDGHQSIYNDAFPVLREYGFPATIFVYSDYVNRGGLTWNQLEEMRSSGLITVLPHSKTHANLVRREQGETLTAYRKRLGQEIVDPAKLLSRKLSEDIFAFAYPYGDTNEEVTQVLRRQGYRMGLTVQPGGNAIFASPFLLRRAMVFGNQGMDHFVKRLETFQPIQGSMDP